jgi:hypothetical protein
MPGLFKDGVIYVEDGRHDASLWRAAGASKWG